MSALGNWISRFLYGYAFATVIINKYNMFSRKKQNFIPNREMGWKKYAYLRNS